jgi:5'/3'-nucleotidase
VSQRSRQLRTAATTSAPTTAAPPTTIEPETEQLRVLVTNDDGVGAAGIDALVEALQTLELDITVVAPATEQSGQGGKVTDGPLTVTDTTTASGFPAKAVAGFPADTVIWADDVQAFFNGYVAISPTPLQPAAG